MGHQFNEVTLLITHYNRSGSLERLLKTFRDMECSFKDIVVSDDASKQEHIDRIKEIQKEYSFQFITTPKNGGLGNNINKGQDAVGTPYTLYVQEDFEPQPGFITHFKDALGFMKSDDQIDIVRFYAYGKFPYLKPYAKGFSEMLFDTKLKGYTKFYLYSDHPHLRRSSFFKKFGRYVEGYNPEQTEYRMMMSVLQQKGKALFYDDFQSLFRHQNSEDEPSTMARSNWRRSDNFVITWIRHLYRYIKFNFDLRFMKLN